MTREAFKAALAAMPSDTLPVWRGVLALIDESAIIEQDAICAPNLSDAEAHRGRGRLGALRDLRQQLNDLYLETHQKPLP